MTRPRSMVAMAHFTKTLVVSMRMRRYEPVEVSFTASGVQIHFAGDDRPQPHEVANALGLPITDRRSFTSSPDSFALERCTYRGEVPVTIYGAPAAPSLVPASELRGRALEDGRQHYSTALGDGGDR